MKAIIKQAAWEKFLQHSGLNISEPNPGIQTVVERPYHSPFDQSVMLTFPYHWWNESEVEFVD